MGLNSAHNRETLWLLVKIFAAALILRAALHVIGYDVHVPVVDDCLDFLLYQFSRIASGGATLAPAPF